LSTGLVIQPNLSASLMHLFKMHA